MSQRFVKLKRRFHVESTVLSAMVAGYAVLLVVGLLMLQHVPKNSSDSSNGLSDNGQKNGTTIIQLKN